MKKLMVGVVALVGLLGACSNDETDYTDAAEKTIREALGDDAEAECADPESTDVGTTFECTGTDAAGVQTAYLTTIDKEDHVTVTPLGEVPEG